MIHKQYKNYFHEISARGVLGHLFFVLVLGLLCGCLPDKEAVHPSSADITEVELGNIQLYIPKPYFHRNSILEKNSIWLSAMYPEFTPLMQDSRTLWDKGEWYKHISIVVQQDPKPLPIDLMAQNFMEFLKANELAGTEYNLIHYKQPESEVRDFHDVFLDKNNGAIQSFLTCSEKIIKEDVPHCSQYIRYLSFVIKADYDKRLLGDAQDIRSGIIYLLENFQSPKTAEAAMNKKINYNHGDE